MFLIAFKFAVIATLAVQFIEAGAVFKPRDGEKEAVNETLQLLISNCETASTHFNSVNENLVDQIQIYKEVQDSNTPPMISDEIAEYQKIIDHLRKTGPEECFEGVDELLDAIEEAGNNYINDCVNSNYEMGIQLLSNGKKSVKINFRTVAQLQDDLALCDDDDVDCISEVAQIVSSCARYPDNFIYQAKLISHVSEFIAIMFGSCGTEGYYDVEDQAKALVSKITDCINQ